MNLILCVAELRPDVTWKDNRVNGFDLKTIAETYQSKDTLPTYQDCLDIWPVIEARQVKESGDRLVKKKLEEIDLKSIRAIREYIAALPDAPQILKDREAEAISERAKLQK